MHGATCRRALAQPLPLLRCHGRARQTRGSSACAWGGRAGHGQRFPLLAVAHLSWLPAPPPRLWAPHQGLRAARAGVSASPQPPPRSLLQAGAASAAPWEAVCTRELCVFILFLFCLISAPLGAPRSAGTSLRRLLLLEPLSPARWAARGAAAPSPQSAGGEIRLCSGARGHHSLGEKHTEVLSASSSTSLGWGGDTGSVGSSGAHGERAVGELCPGETSPLLLLALAQGFHLWPWCAPGCRGWTGRKPHRENHHRKNHLRENHLREYHHHFQGWPQLLAPPAALGGNRHPAGTDQPASA